MKEKIEKILEDYKDLVKSKAGIYFMFGGDKDDLMQEGMIGLVKAYNSFDASKGVSFKAYAGLCVEREIINAVKAANRKKDQALNTAVDIAEAAEDEKGLSAGNDFDPESNAIFNDLLEELKTNKSGNFSGFEHEVILNLLEGKTYIQIADALGKTPKSIDNALQRIKAKVRAI